MTGSSSRSEIAGYTSGRHVPAPETFATRAEATTWIAEIQAGVTDLEPLRPGADRPTLRRYADDWLTTRALAPRTRDLYRWELRKHILPTFVPWIAALAGLRKGEGAVIGPPKSRAGVRTVAMPKTLIEIVEDHLEAHVEHDPDAPVFSNSHGRPVRASVWNPTWDKARKAVPTDVRLHDLRHLAGTLTAQAGATLRETMDRLGYSSPQAALRNQHVAQSRPGQMAEAIDRLIPREGGTTRDP